MITMTTSQFADFVDSLAEAIAHDLEQEIVKKCPVDTGALRNSITIVRHGNQFSITALDYLMHVEFGTPPHIIRVKDKKVLSNGKVFFGKEVHHPGTRPQPIIRTTIRQDLPRIVQRNVTRLLSRWQR